MGRIFSFSKLKVKNKHALHLLLVWEVPGFCSCIPDFGEEINSYCSCPRFSKFGDEIIRALLIDKGKNPQWKPDSLEKVTSDIVKRYFAPLPDDRELKI